MPAPILQGHSAPSRPAPTAMAGIRVARHAGPGATIVRLLRSAAARTGTPGGRGRGAAACKLKGKRGTSKTLLAASAPRAAGDVMPLPTVTVRSFFVFSHAGLLEGPDAGLEGPDSEPAMGSLGAGCSAVFIEIQQHADAAPASAAEMPPDGARRARSLGPGPSRSPTDDLDV